MSCFIYEISLLALSLSELPLQTYYHVVFFDSKEPTTQWLKVNQIQNFTKNKHLRERSPSIYQIRINWAFEEAQRAVTLPLLQRLEKYSFISLCPDKIKEYEDKHPLRTEKRNFVTNLKESAKKNTKKRKYVKDNKHSTEPNAKEKKTSTTKIKEVDGPDVEDDFSINKLFS